MSAWEVLELSDVPPRVATIPAEAWPALGLQAAAAYVRVTVNGRTRWLSALPREAAQGHQVFVRSGTFGLPAGRPGRATVTGVSERAARLGLVCRTRDGIWSLVGLALAIAGTVVQAANAARARPAVLWIVIGCAAQVLGLAAVFWRGVLKLSSP